MKLIKLNNTKLNQSREVTGLVSCQMEYEVTSAGGRLQYAGPRFSREMWHQVMSFFRWTFKEMDSESQVRLYVNPKLGRWGAWAFPQEARTGMSARELPRIETPEQAKERFAYWESEPSDDWLYFGTAHHHCTAGAFQSGTDERNEWNQDGLHFTVGAMNAARHELHARFYLDGNCFEPDFSRFWPLDLELTRRMPAGILGELARFEMGEKVTMDFPETWRRNVVEVKSAKLELSNGHNLGFDERDIDLPWWNHTEDALVDLSRRCAAASVSEDQLLSELGALATNDASNAIIATCVKHNVTPDELLDSLRELDNQTK